jgi:RimJ/RimL family protein N-acetyltransferase
MTDTDTRPRQVLQGSRFTLRPFRESDISDRYVAWLNDPEVNRYLEVRHLTHTRESVVPWVNAFYGAEEKYIWGIFPSGESEPIGTTTVYDINRHYLRAEFGIMIGERSYWGNGTGEEVIRLVMDFAFNTLGLRRLTGSSYASNRGMNFTFKKLGFTLEGRQREAVCLVPGKYEDYLKWALLRSEWEHAR